MEAIYVYHYPIELPSYYNPATNETWATLKEAWSEYDTLNPGARPKAIPQPRSTAGDAFTGYQV